MQRLAIQKSLKCTRTLQIFIDPQSDWYFIYIRHRVNITIYLSNCMQTYRCEH